MAEEYKADLVVIDYPSPTQIRKDNFLGHLFFGLGGNNYEVEAVLVNGKPRMKDSELVGLDEGEIYENARRVSKRLWERLTGDGKSPR